MQKPAVVPWTSSVFISPGINLSRDFSGQRCHLRLHKGSSGFPNEAQRATASRHQKYRQTAYASCPSRFVDQPLLQASSTHPGSGEAKT